MKRGEEKGICFIATKQVERRFQHDETRMKPALRSSGVSWEPLSFTRKEMDKRKHRERKDRDERKNSKINYKTVQ